VDEHGAPVGPQLYEQQAVSVDEIGSLIRQKRRTERLTLEQAARQSGVSAATLSRLERRGGMSASGREMPTPDMRTISAITDWLGISVMGGGFAPTSRFTPNETPAGASLPTIVEAHLRADRNLNSETAGLLARMFRAAYDEAATSNAVQTSDSKDFTGDTGVGKEAT